MTLHADAQGAALAFGILPHARFGEFELRQHAIGEAKQILARLREPHAAPFARPHRRAQLLLQLLHRMAQRGLREVEHGGGGGQRALALDFSHAHQMRAFEHRRLHEQI
jgi:hypothetical protein